MSIAAIPFDHLVKGKRSAQYKLYNLYAPKMYAICLRYASCREEAEDIVQEGFIKVFRNLRQFSGQGSFEGWMRRIFINTAIGHLRKRMFMEPIDSLDNDTPRITGTSGYDRLAYADLVKMIGRLSEGYRTIFNLYVIEGFSHKEIAGILNITESTSKSQLSRARIILQKSLMNIGIAA